MRDLLTEMIITSDNTATDMVLRRIGGTAPVNDFLAELGYEATPLNQPSISDFFRQYYAARAPEFSGISEAEDMFALCCGHTLLGNAPSMDERRDSPLRVLERDQSRDGQQDVDPDGLIHPPEQWCGRVTPRAMGRFLEEVESCAHWSESSCEEMRRILRNTQASGLPIAGALGIHLDVPVGYKTGGYDGVRNHVGIVYAGSGPIVVAFYTPELTGSPADAEIRMGEVARMIVEYFDGGQ